MSCEEGRGKLTCEVVVERTRLVGVSVKLLMVYALRRTYSADCRAVSHVIYIHLTN